MRVKILFAFALVTIVVGCAPTYVRPGTSGETASVSFFATSDNFLGFVAGLRFIPQVSSRPCSDSIERMATISRGNPLVMTGETQDIPIRAGSDITLQTVMVPNGGPSVRVWTHNISFVPLAGKRYRATIDGKGGGAVVLLEALESDGEWSAVRGVSVKSLKC